MSLHDLPTELCVEIFKLLPGKICVIRKKYVSEVVQACQRYDAGNPGPVSRLPDYELSQWLQMRRYYRICRGLRDIAVSAQVQQRWLSNFSDPKSSPVIPRAPAIASPTTPNQTKLYPFASRAMTAIRLREHRMNYPGTPTHAQFDIMGKSRYRDLFCSIGASNYIVIELTDNWRDRPISQIGYFSAAAENFVWCAENKALFKTATKVDLIVGVPARQRRAMGSRLDGMVDSVKRQWEHFGVQNGVVRMFWDD